MGTSRSVGQLVGKVGRYADAQEGVAREAVVGATRVVRGAIDAELLANTHGNRRLSGVGKKGAKLTVLSTVTGNRGVITARGPWQLIEGATKRHDIQAKGTRGRRRGAKALVIGGNLRASAKNTGGSKAKEPFAKGTVAGRPLAKTAFTAAEDAALKEVFG